MSGLCNYYQIPVSNSAKFFKSVNLFTSPYENKRNYLQLYPNDINIEVNQVFVNAALDGLGARVETCIDRSKGIDWSNPRPRPYPKFVCEVDVIGGKAREAVSRLFQREEISADERSIIEDPLRKLERCLDYNSKLSADISSAQKSIIEFFVDPYLQILKDKMELWQIKQAIRKACIVVGGYVDPEDAFKPVMRKTLINREPCQATSDTNPSVFVINKEWDKDTQNEILDSLYMIGKVLSGRANLEGALIQSGATLPNLKIQEQVVMGLFGFSE